MNEPLPFDFTGGHLALDFANTIGARNKPVKRERLVAYGRLVDFAVETGLSEASHAEAWRAWDEAHPGDALALVEQGKVLREALYRMFRAVANDASPEPDDIAILNGWNARVCLGTDLEWHWCDGDDAPDAMFAPIVRAAVDLITDEQRGRVRICEAHTCEWVFLDKSRNRSRRWCDMSVCGNRAKARRFYERHKD